MGKSSTRGSPIPSSSSSSPKPPASPQQSRSQEEQAPEDESTVLKILQLVLVLVAITGTLIYFNPTRINPVPIQLPPLPTVPVSYELDLAEPVFRAPRRLQGPESIAIHPTNGFLYSGTQDGRIMRARLAKPYNSSPETLGMIGDPNKALPLPCGTYTTEPICGRPLGMKMATHRDKTDPILFFVDAYLGVAQYNAKNHQLQMLVEKQFSAKDLKTGKMHDFSDLFFNDVAYDSTDHVVYFTVSSTKFQLNEILYDLLDMGTNGMLMKVDLNNGVVSIISRDIAFANGIVIHPTKRVLYLAELGRARILAVNIDNRIKSKYGTISTFAKNLPVLPDNIAIIGDDELWVAGVGLRVGGISNGQDPSQFPAQLGFSAFDWLAQFPKIRLFIAKAVPAQFAHYITGNRPGGIVRLDLDSGNVLKLMVASNSHRNSSIQGIGRSVASITPHYVTDGSLPEGHIHVYMGGFTPQTSSIGRFTWDLNAKEVVPSLNPTTNDQIRDEYRNQLVGKKNENPILDYTSPSKYH